MHLKGPFMSRSPAISVSLCVGTFMFLSLVGPQDASARGRTIDEQERSVLSILSAHEYRPDLQVLRRVGPDVSRVLIRISSRKSVRLSIRLRAVATLELYPGEAIRRYLLTVLHDPLYRRSDLGLGMRRQAIRTLAKAFGDSVVDDLLELKQDVNAQLREAVAYGLGETGSRRAVPHLKSWLQRESELFVKLAIDKALNSLYRAER